MLDVLNGIISIVAYAFVKSFPQGPDHVQPASPLVRIAIISLGPIVWNAAVLLVLFLVSLFLGPMLDTCCAKFGAVMASIAHFLAVVGIVAFFEFLVRISFSNLFIIVNPSPTSGSLSSGMRHTRCWVSSRSYLFNVPSTRSSSLCSFLVNSNTTKRTEHGGLESGMVAV